MDGRKYGQSVEANTRTEMKDVASLNAQDLQSVTAKQRAMCHELIALRQREQDDEHGLFHDFPNTHERLPSWSSRLAVAVRNVDVAVNVSDLAHALEELAAISACWREALHRRMTESLRTGRPVGIGPFVAFSAKPRPWWKRMFRR